MNTRKISITVLGLGLCGAVGFGGYVAASANGEPPLPVAIQAEAAQPTDWIPGAGDVDVARGPMVENPPFDLKTETITPGEPVKVGTGHDTVGWVAYSDFNPRLVPEDPATPIPMVPIRDEKGSQIGWWAGPLGWITFDQIRERFDYDAAWAAWLRGDRPAHPQG